MSQANHSNQISTGVHKNEHDELEAWGDWVLVTRKTAPEMHSAGKTDDGRDALIALPPTARATMEAEFVGTVVSIGDDAQAKHKKLKLGDRIVYTRVFPMNKAGSKDEIYSYVHKNNILGPVRSKAITPGMAPEVEPFRQS